MRTAVGVFDPIIAGRVIDDLSRIGCSKQRMSVIAHQPSPDAPTGPADLARHIGPLHEANMSGVGYVFVTGPLGDIFAGADLRSALVANGLTDEEASRYVDEVNQGSAIVAAEVDEGQLQQALNVMSTSAHGRAMGMATTGPTDVTATPSQTGGGTSTAKPSEEPVAVHQEKVTVERKVDRPVEASNAGGSFEARGPHEEPGTWEKIKTAWRNAFEGKNK
jgi:hypothetical protein